MQRPSGAYTNGLAKSFFDMSKGYVYIMTNKHHTVLYTGMTGHLKDRVINHKIKKYRYSFSARYNIDKLVYYEEFDDIKDAYRREQQIKKSSRKKKIVLIEKMNPSWEDLYEKL